MKLLLIAVTLCSTAIAAQEKDKKQPNRKTDTVKFFKLDSMKIKPSQQTNQQKDLYRMPTAKPREDIRYSGLNKKIDSKDYKMLSPNTLEKPKDTLKTK